MGALANICIMCNTGVTCGVSVEGQRSGVPDLDGSGSSNNESRRRANFQPLHPSLRSREEGY